MNRQLEDDLLQLDLLLDKVKTQGLDYLQNISNRKTSSNSDLNFPTPT